MLNPVRPRMASVALLCCGVQFGSGRRGCGGCGVALDAFGDHALSCTSMGLYARHNVLRDTLATCCLSAGFPCRTEVQLPGTALVPADIFLPTLFNDAPTAVDVAVVHPLHPSHPAQAAMTTGAAAEARAAAKVAKYSESCRQRAWDYRAVVAETTGAWNQAGQRLVRRLAREHALRSGVDPAEAAAGTWCALSRALARAVGRQLVRARQQGVGHPPGPPLGGGTAAAAPTVVSGRPGGPISPGEGSAATALVADR